MLYPLCVYRGISSHLSYTPSEALSAVCISHSGMPYPLCVYRGISSHLSYPPNAALPAVCISNSGMPYPLCVCRGISPHLSYPPNAALPAVCISNSGMSYPLYVYRGISSHLSYPPNAALPAVCISHVLFIRLGEDVPATFRLVGGFVSYWSLWYQREVCFLVFGEVLVLRSCDRDLTILTRFPKFSLSGLDSVLISPSISHN
jgi:branched-subunit amino acid transport protein